MIHCRYLGLPSSLANAGSVLKIEQQKMTEGKALIKFFCVPYAFEDGRPLFHEPADYPEKWELFKTYNKQDVEAEIEIENRLAKFPVPDFLWQEFYFEWVKSLRAECVTHNITFCFIETGTVFIKDGKRYHLPKKQIQSEMAYKSCMNFVGKPIEWRLVDHFGIEIPKEQLYVPHYRKNCEHCGSRLICNGCSDCGRCQ